MIAIVQGTLLEQGSDHILVDTGGIGYRVHVPLRTLAELGHVGERVSLRTHLEVREDSWTLFGFSTAAEVEMFHLLISVNGVGPKSALAILSVHTHPEVARGIQAGDDKMFTRISGIGKKTAARILLDLGDKVARLTPGLELGGVGAMDSGAPAAPGQGSLGEVRLALESLGFKGAEVDAAAQAACEELGDDAPVPDLLKRALAHFRKQ